MSAYLQFIILLYKIVMFYLDDVIYKSARMSTVSTVSIILGVLENAFGVHENETILPLNAGEVSFLKRVVAAEPTLFDGLVIDGSLTVSDIPKLVFIWFNAFNQKLVNTDINVDIINVLEFVLTIVIQACVPGVGEAAILVEVLAFSVQLLRTELPAIKAGEKYIADHFCGWVRSFGRLCYNGVTRVFRFFRRPSHTVVSTNAC